MKTKLFRWTIAALAAAGTASLVSCVYDPYYGGGYGYGGGYDDYGYGYGSYGYGPTVHTSLIITSDSRWGYDRYRHCYYDYHRRAYYDPYLYGYYPAGYLPPIIYGAPHPYGWYPGRGTCPPPRHIRTGYISNYRNRVELLRERDYSWARTAREDRAPRPDFRSPQERQRGDFNRFRDSSRGENMPRLRESRDGLMPNFRDSRGENLPGLRESRGETPERFRRDRIENVERVRDIRQANLDRFSERHGDTHQRVIETRQANIDRFQRDRTTNFNRIADKRAGFSAPAQSMRAQNATRQEARAEYRQERKESKKDDKENNGRGYGR